MNQPNNISPEEKVDTCLRTVATQWNEIRIQLKQHFQEAYDESLHVVTIKGKADQSWKVSCSIRGTSAGAAMICVIGPGPDLRSYYYLDCEDLVNKLIRIIEQ